MSDGRDIPEGDPGIGAHAREYLRGERDVDPEAPDASPLIDDDLLRRFYVVAANGAYDPSLVETEGRSLPRRFDETDMSGILRALTESETLQESLDDRNLNAQAFVTGSPSARDDASGIHVLRRIEDLMGHAAPVAYIFGRMGNGKTSKMLLFAEVWKDLHPDGELVTNVTSWQEADRYVESYGELMQVIDEKREQEDPDPWLFGFDEASSTASGRGAQGHETGKKFAPLVYKIRKTSGGLVVVGHDGRDVHPALRSVGDVVRAESKKRMVVANDVKNRGLQDVLFEVSGVPDTNMTFDTTEASTWSWEEQPESEEDELLRLAEERAEDMVEEEVEALVGMIASETSVSQSELARAVGYSQSWVSERQRGYENA